MARRSADLLSSRSRVRVAASPSIESMSCGPGDGQSGADSHVYSQLFQIFDGISHPIQVSS